MNYNDPLDDILRTYDDTGYPEEFYSKYDIMECLSDLNGIITFLVRDKNGTEYIAKCFERSLWNGFSGNEILTGLAHKGLPEYVATYENGSMMVAVRKYVSGVSLDRYASENDISQQKAVDICLQLCDILMYLHHRDTPVIHRDIKPQNIIIRPDGSIVLIDFDIARMLNSENETDTVFFGTRSYAPPEQYGFSQTDERTDIYALGILLRWLLTGSTKENKKIKIYRPLENIIKKCTGFSPKERFSDAGKVKKALEKANPRSQAIRMTVLITIAALSLAVLCFAGIKIYKYATYSPFNEDAIPAFLSDEETVKDAVKYMKDKYGTAMFDDDTTVARVGDLRKAMIDFYGLDRDYVYGINTDMPQENDAYFLPWGWDDNQTLDKNIVIYAAVKVHDPAYVADWSSLKDDNGYYPGTRVAVAFAEENGIAELVHRPSDITLGDMAVILANTDRIFETEK
ncbi:MAG: serine/threonine protein kinase [Lachnospiraceae bacterium]|nr:serine/threonine protein kinase [Lachnospiraceae bacterium]